MEAGEITDSVMLFVFSLVMYNSGHMKITFYYIRHGRTLFNEIGRMQGQCDSPLTEEGIHGAEDTASALRKVHFDGLYCSSSGRAVDTAVIIGKPHDLIPVEMKELKEFDFGRLDGQLFSEMKDEIQKHRLKDDWTDVGGENVEMFAQRASAGFQKIIDRQKDGDRVLIVSHGSYMMHLMKTLLHYDQQEYIARKKREGKERVPNCSITVFTYEDGKWTLCEEPVTADEYRKKHDSKTVHFYLMRHGETQFNKAYRMQGWCDSPLTEEGIAQAEKAEKYLADVSFARVYASDTERAADTAGIIGQMKVIRDKRLKEVFFGSLEGTDYRTVWNEIQERHRQVHYGDLGGEDRNDVEKRIYSFFRDAVDEADDGDHVLLVSHGDYYFTLMETLFDISRDTLYSEAMEKHMNPTPNCGLARFDYDTESGFTLIHAMQDIINLQ